MKVKTFILTFLMMMSSPFLFGQNHFSPVFVGTDGTKTITAKVTLDGRTITEADSYELAAFCGDVCNPLAEFKTEKDGLPDGMDDIHYAAIVIHNSNKADDVYFKLWDGSKEYVSENKISWNNEIWNSDNGEIGGLDNLYGINFKSVAQIEGTDFDVVYPSLPEAYDAAEPNATVTLLTDAEGAGLKINKNITIDLGDHAYTINKAVGSKGTESQGFQLLKGNDVTIKNGNVAVKDQATHVVWMFNAYADLTLEDIIVDCANMDGDERYVVVANNGGGATPKVTLNNVIYNNFGEQNPIWIDTNTQLAAGPDLEKNIDAEPGYNIVYENGIYSLKEYKAHFKSGAYARFVAGKNREHFSISIYDVNAKESLVLKVYHNEELLVTTTLKGTDTDSGKSQYPYVTAQGKSITANNVVNINDAGVKHSGSWDNVWNVSPTVANVPNRYEVYVDGIKTDELDLTAGEFAGFGTATDLQTYLEFNSVYKRASVTTAEGKTTYHMTLAEAVNAVKGNETIKLLDNVTVSEVVKINAPVNIDLNGKTVTANCQKAFEVYANATIKNGTIESQQRCVDTRKNVELTLENLELSAPVYHNAHKNQQPLTIGGSDNGTIVTMNNVKIDAGHQGYGIIAFVKTELTATNSEIAGYTALWTKPGSEGSTFNFVNSTVKSDISKNDVPGNSFATIVTEANATINLDKDSELVAVGNNQFAMSVESVTGNNITIAGTITANNILAGTVDGNTIKVRAEYAKELLAEGYVTGEADADGLVQVLGTKVAKIGENENVKYFASFTAAINAAKDNDVITLLTDIDENVTIKDKKLTIDGEGSNYTGQILTNVSTTYPLTFKNFNIDGAGNYFVKTSKPNGGDLTFDNCNMKNSQGGLIYTLYETNTVTIKNSSVDNCTYGIGYFVALNNARIENVIVTNSNYGFIIRNQAEHTVTLVNSDINAKEGVVHIDEKGKSTITVEFEGVTDIHKESTDFGQYVKIVADAQIGTKVYGKLADAFAAAKKSDVIKLLNDVTLTKQIQVSDKEVLSGITLNGNNKTITASLDENNSPLYFGNTSTGAWATGVTINDLTVKTAEGTKARFGIFLGGGTSSVLNNVKVEGEYYYYGINLYGTHGATMTNCDVVTLFTNAQDANPLNLANTHIGHLFANKSDVTEELPKVFADDQTVIDELTFWGESTIMISPDAIDNVRKINEAVAECNKIYYKTFDAAFVASAEDDKIDIVSPASITEDKEYDLANRTITYSSTEAAPAIRILADVTVKNGTMTTTNEEGNNYCFIVGNKETAGTLTIESGIYDASDGGTSAVHVTNGTLYIKGGEFKSKEYNGDYRYLINCADANYNNNTAKVEITGGRFYNWNPQNNAAEGANTNFCANGYAAKEVETNVWEVFPAIARIGEVYYATLQDAINAVADGETIELLSDCAEDVTIVQTEGVSFTIDGKIDEAKAQYTGTINIDGNNGYDREETLAIKNIKFYNEERRQSSSVLTFIKATTPQSHNVTVENCDFIDNYSGGRENYVKGANVSEGNNWKFINCTDNEIMMNIIQYNKNSENLVVEGGTIKSRYGINIGNSKNGLFKDITFESGERGFTISESADGDITNTLDNISFNKNVVNPFYPSVTDNGNVTRVFNIEGNITSEGWDSANGLDIAKFVLTTEESTFQAPDGLNVEITNELTESGYILNYSNGVYSVIEGNVLNSTTDNKYATLQEAIDKANKGDEIVVLKDIELTEPIVVGKDVNLNMNEKNISNAEGVTVYPIIRVQNNATVTIDGNGTIDNALDYVFVLGSSDKQQAGNLVINSGEFKGNITTASVTKGTLTINGGEFATNESEYGADFLINCIDESYKAGEANVAIYGGTFYGFNPEDNVAENPKANFCAEGFGAVDNGDRTYTVMPLQEQSLVQAWNWFSTYLDIEVKDLTKAIGNNGTEIKNDNGPVAQPLGNLWTIMQQEMNHSKMYMINVKEECSLRMAANVVNAEDYTITLSNGWSWIGYPSNQDIDINDALANIPEPKDGDRIKSQYNGYAEYRWGQWRGSLTTLVPGIGYMYNNKSGNVKEFKYAQAATRGTVKANVTSENNYWTPNTSKYPYNMTMTAVVEGMENANYEVAAFVNGEVRGSARPIYIEPMDAHILFITIHGEDVEEMTFRLYDIDTDTEYELNDRINYSNNAELGSIAEPYMLTRGTTGIGEAAMSNVNIYPNPTTTGTEINLHATCDKVEVFNALGVKVVEYQNVDSIDALETAGIYVIRITNNGNTQNCRLVVK